MSKRGRVPLEQKMGERFNVLLKTMDIPSIAGLICEHEIDTEKKKACEACRRAIYRAKERLEAANRSDKTFEPIAEFEEIPEIKDFTEYCKGKVKTTTTEQLTSKLLRMWQWIRNSEKPELVQLQRPAVWTTKHVDYILIKIDEQKVARYTWVQALRSFFKSMKRNDMLNESQLKARRRDMRSPKGPRRMKDRFTPDEFSQILSYLNEDEAFIVKMHITLKCRESVTGIASLLNLQWKNINWKDDFYGLTDMVTATVWESKAKGGGTYWEHCPVDLWFADLSKELKGRFENRVNDHVFQYTYDQYAALWNKISKVVGQDFEPHDCRRSPSGWLRDLGLSDLAIGQYDARSGKAVGFAGVGWENAEIFFQRYGKMNPRAIYDKKQRMDMSMFNGLINKILEQKQ